jgi:ABC-type phosphate transport system permease subunit
MASDGRTSPTDHKLRRTKKRRDLFLVLTWVASVASVATLLWILESIVTPAWPAIQQNGLGFLTSTVWDVNRNRYGALPFLIGTAASSLIALGIALPLGVFIALFLSENFLPRAVRQVIRFVVELLAAIPSVVYGLWGIAVVIPIVQQFGGYLSDSLGFIPLFSGPVWCWRSWSSRRLRQYPALPWLRSRLPCGRALTQLERPVGKQFFGYLSRRPRRELSRPRFWPLAGRWAKPWLWRC